MVSEIAEEFAAIEELPVWTFQALLDSERARLFRHLCDGAHQR
jgi:hypothetical protein